jgi:hypothetical protein
MAKYYIGDQIYEFGIIGLRSTRRKVKKRTQNLVEEAKLERQFETSSVQ